MIGLPPFAGYVAKEAGLEALGHLDDTTAGMIAGRGVGRLGADRRVRAAAVVGGLRDEARRGAGSGRASRRSRAPRSTRPRTTRREPAPITHPSLLLVWPAMILAVLGLAVALLPQLGEHLLAPYADTYPEGEPGHLVLWAGFTPTFVLTLAILLSGALLFVVRDRVERWQSRRLPRARGGPRVPAVHAAARRRGGRRHRGHPARFAAAVPRPDPRGVRRWRSAARLLVSTVFPAQVTVVGRPGAGRVRGRRDRVRAAGHPRPAPAQGRDPAGRRRLLGGRVCTCCTAPPTWRSRRCWSRRSRSSSSCWCCAGCPRTSPTVRSPPAGGCASRSGWRSG